CNPIDARPHRAGYVAGRRTSKKRGPRPRATATARRCNGASGRFIGPFRVELLRSGARGFQGMERFVSTFTNKIDAKGRVSIPAPFRAVLERDGYAHASAGGIYCYPALEAPALDAGGERLAKKIDGLLSGLPDYSDERDELSVALYPD